MRVVATEKGFYIGPREPGDEFDMPLKADGSKPKSKWFKEIAEVRAPAAHSNRRTLLTATDEDLA